MTSAAELQAQNEHMTREIYALLHANTTLDNEVVELTSERDKLQFIGNKKMQTLEEELEKVDKELTSLRVQCQSITDIIKNIDIENEIEVEEVLVSHNLSSAISQRTKGISMPTRQRSSTAEMVAYGITKAASYITPSIEKPIFDTLRLAPKMNKDSPAILSYAKSTVGSTKSLLYSTHSHYGNFRRRSGPCRKGRDPVMAL